MHVRILYFALLRDRLGRADQTLELPDGSTAHDLLEALARESPVIAGARVALAGPDASAVKSLYVSCHRCGFYDPPEFEALKKPLTKVKASLRIVGGDPSTSAPWIDITDATVTLDPVAAAHGGIHGYRSGGGEVGIEIVQQSEIHRAGDVQVHGALLLHRDLAGDGKIGDGEMSRGIRGACRNAYTQ